MQKKIVSLAAPILIGIIALALGWLAHAALPLAAQGIVLDGHAARSDPAAPAVGALARLTYQGRLTNSSGAPINTPVSMVFKLYDNTPTLVWTSAPHGATPVNGLFTVYLGEGFDPDLNNTILGEAASIGVTIGSDAEMTPPQPLNSVVGHSVDGAGVLGSSSTNAGVLGSSIGNAGVAGSSIGSVGVYGSSNTNYGVQGTSATGNGVVGTAGVITRAAVLAQAAGSAGIAFEVSSGGIKAPSTSITNSNTFAFVHVASSSNINFTYTLIDNALTNGDPNAMLFVTHVFNPTGVPANHFNKAFGVFYQPAYEKWGIYPEDDTNFPTGITFNVMVIKR